MNFNWKRPENVPFPSVWLNFKAKDSDSDNLVNYVVQDLPENRYNDAVQHMTENFLHAEPISSSTELFNDEKSVKELQGIWHAMLKQKIVLACFKENSDELVGINMVGISTEEEKSSVYTPVGDKWTQVYNTIELVMKQFDVMKHYDVDKYMVAFGLSVTPKYRGRGIATQILQARVPMGKAVGIKLTATVFTSIASQVAAYKIKFELNYEITYKELEEKGFLYPGVTTKSIKLMSLRID